MTDITAHGIAASLPSGWEGRVFRRPTTGQVAATAADGPPAPYGETTHAVLHASTIALATDIGDFASGAVDQLAADDILVVLFEYDPASSGTALFKQVGIPRQLDADDFSPNVMQRAIRGQAGVQRFFNDQGRAFCLYVVIGSYANRQALVARVNEVLATLTIDPGGAAASGAPTSSAPTSTSTTTPTSGAPTTEPPTTTTALDTTTP